MSRPRYPQLNRNKVFKMGWFEASVFLKKEKENAREEKLKAIKNLEDYFKLVWGPGWR